jgi:hypothetical protein
MPKLESAKVAKVAFSDGLGARTTPAFDAETGDILFAFAASDEPASRGQFLNISGSGLTWTLVARSNEQLGVSEIWTAVATAKMKVAVASVQEIDGYYQSLTVVAFRGVKGVGASALASGPTGAPAVSITTTRPGSLVYGVGNDWDKAIDHKVGTDQKLLHQSKAPIGDTFWVQNREQAVASPTQVQLTNTAPTTDRWNFAAVEVTVR